MTDQWQWSFMLLLRLSSTIAMHSMQWRRRQLLTSFNECSVWPHVWLVTHGSSTAVWRYSCTMSSIGWTCQCESPISWASWCTAVFTVWHLGTSLTNSLQPLTSLQGFVCVPQTDISLLYLAVDSIHTAIGRFRLPVRWSGIRCRVSWERVVLTVLNSFSRQSFLVSTNVTSALEVFLNDVRYINSRFTYLLYLLTNSLNSKLRFV